MKTFAILFFSVIAAIILILFIACGFIFNQLVWRKTIPVPKFILNAIAGYEIPTDYDRVTAEAEKKLWEMPIETVEINAPDGEKLIARVVTPEKSNGRLILACHGVRSWGIGEFCLISEYLYKNGYTFILPDHRGCGDSGGKFMGYGTHESKDSYLWIDYAKQHFPDLDIFLMGVSMGGATVLMMSKTADDEAIKGIIADCAYTSAWDEFSYQLKTSFHLPAFPIVHICNLYSRIFAGYSFKEASPIEAVKQAKKPVLFIHGGNDDFVPTFMEKQLYDACCAEKEMVTVENAVHARSYYADSKTYEAAIESFMDKYSEIKA